MGTAHSALPFLHKLVEQSTSSELAEYRGLSSFRRRTGPLYLYFLDYHEAAEYEFPPPLDAQFRAEIIDPRKMTITPVAGTFSGNSKLKLLGKPHMAAGLR